MATVYAVASAKGGVGKTTTTAAVATLLAEAGADVVAVDADIGMANLAGALGIDPGETTVHDVLAGRADPTEAVHEGPAGLRVVPGETDLDAYAEADPAGIRGVVAAFEDADYVFIDAGAGLSHDSSLPLALADETLLVSTAERGALGDTEKTRQLTERLGGTVAGAALTRVDPDEPETPLVAELLETDVIGRIPEDDAVGEAGAANRPLVTYAPTAPATRAYRDLARALTGHPVPKIDETAHPETDDGEVIEETSADDSGVAGAAGTVGTAAGDDGEVLDDTEADGEDQGEGESEAGSAAEVEPETEAEVDDDPDADADTDAEAAEAAEEDAADADEDILVADPEPAGVAEEGDEEDIIVAESEAEVEEDLAGEGAAVDETGAVEPDDDDAEADDSDESDEPEEHTESTESSDNEDVDDEEADDDEEAVDDEYGSVAADDAAAEAEATAESEAELTDEEAAADETGAVERDDAAAEEVEVDDDAERKTDAGIPEAEPDREADDDLDGSVPFRDDDTGTAMQSTIEEAESEEDEETDEKEDDRGFFRRLLGR